MKQILVFSAVQYPAIMILSSMYDINETNLIFFAIGCIGTAAANLLVAVWNAVEKLNNKRR